jgi:hypothetical protein
MRPVVLAAFEAFTAARFYGYVDRTSDGRAFYVGKGTLRRVRLIKRRNTKHRGVAAKYGITRTVEFSSDVESEVLAWERSTIALLGTSANVDGIGCNFTAGGETIIFSEETLKRMREARRRRPPVSPETLAKMSASKKGRPSPAHSSPIWRAAVAAANARKRGRPMSAKALEACRRRADRVRGCKQSPLPEEVRKKISASLKGRKIPAEVLAKRGPRK